MHMSVWVSLHTHRCVAKRDSENSREKIIGGTLVKRRKPTFGFAEVDYRLRQIFERAANNSAEADVTAKQLGGEFQRAKGNLDPHTHDRGGAAGAGHQ